MFTLFFFLSSSLLPSSLSSLLFFPLPTSLQIQIKSSLRYLSPNPLSLPSIFPPSLPSVLFPSSVFLSSLKNPPSFLFLREVQRSRDHMSLKGRWCSGILPGLLRRRSGVRFPDPPTLEKCAKGIYLCNLIRSTQPNDRETVIEGSMRRVSVKRSR